MAFGRFGRMGAGFGRIGAGGSNAPSGGALLLLTETDGFAVDFTWPSDAKRVAVKASSAVTSYALDSFFTNTSSTPKLVYDVTGTLVWSPHNMFVNSAAPVTQNLTTVVGQPYTVTIYGSGSMTGSAGASGVATEGAPLTFVATTTSSTFTKAGTVTQIQANRGTVATAYVATGAAVRNGLAIDYDPVTHACRGLLCEIAATNLCLYSNDLTNAAWVKSNATAALTATGPTGATNNSSTLTATAGNATALQAITSVSGARITSVFLKRRTGSGNIDITQDNGTTWVTQSVTSSWARYSLPSVTAANPTVGIRIVTNGDAVDVALFQHETVPLITIGAVTSPIPTGVATVTRAVDNYAVTSASINHSATAGSWWVETYQIGAGASNPRIITYTSAAQPIYHGNSTYFGLNDSVALTKTGVTLFGNTHKVACAFAAGDRAITANGLAVAADAGSTTNLLAPGATINIGNGGTATINGYVRKVFYLPRRMSNAELVSKTA